MSLQSSSSVQNVQGESKYHSFLIIQFKANLADKFPFHVLTKNGEIVTSEKKEPPETQSQYNYMVDCVAYRFNGRPYILAEGQWIKELLSKEQIIKIQNSATMGHKSSFLSIKQFPISKTELLYFFYEKGKEKCYQIVPQFFSLENDCLIFRDFKHQQLLKTVSFKEIDSRNKEWQDQQTEQYYNFNSEYALLSDAHFLTCFVNGFKPISTYKRSPKKQQLFEHFIRRKIVDFLSNLSPQPKL